MATQVKSNSANYNSFAKYKDDLIKVFARINSNDNLYDQQHMEGKAITLEIQEKFKSFRFTDFHSPYFKNKDGQGGWVQGTKDAQHWEIDNIGIGANKHGVVACTASVKEALFIIECCVAGMGKKILEIWNTPPKQRSAKFLQEELDVYKVKIKQVPKKRDRFFNALKPSETKVVKSSNEKVVIQLDNIKKILDKQDQDYTQEMRLINQLRTRFTKVN
tara:strand:+ start:258 stop:911 length:654 start_codon:yes stop_codon:yes gene_type:complete